MDVECVLMHMSMEIEKAGIEKIGIQSSIRIAAVINATAQSITIN